MEERTWRFKRLHSPRQIASMKINKLLLLLAIFPLASITACSSDNGSSSEGGSEDSSNISSSEDIPQRKRNPNYQQSIYYNTPAIADDVYVFNADNSNSYEIAMILSLQGILAQTQATIYMKYGSSYDTWFNAIKTQYPNVTVHDETKDPWALVDMFKSAVNNKYVSYTHASRLDLSINHAATIAGVEHYLMVDKSLEATAIAHGLTLGEDATETSTRELFEKYKNQLNNNLLINQNPQSTNTLRDYGIAAKAMCVFFDYEGNYDARIRSDISEWLVYDAPVLGWTTNEIPFVEVNSLKSLVTIPADYAANLSFLSAYQNNRTLIQSYASKVTTAEPGKHYLAIVMSDGDNIQWDLGGLHTSGDWYSNSKRGHFPLTWTLSPSLSSVAKMSVEYVYDQATDNDYFIAGPSGYGYTNLTEYTSKSTYAEICDIYMRKSGLEYINFLDNKVDKTALEEVMKYNSVKGGVWSVEDYYADGHGGVYWVHNKPVVAVKEVLWSPSNGLFDNLDVVASRINNYSTDPTNISSYTVLAAHVWSLGKLNSLETFVGKLGSHVQLVTVKEMLDLVKDNVSHVDKEAADDYPALHY